MVKLNPPHSLAKTHALRKYTTPRVVLYRGRRLRNSDSSDGSGGAGAIAAKAVKMKPTELNPSANAIANVLSVRSLACNHALRRLELRDNPLSVSPRCE